MLLTDRIESNLKDTSRLSAKISATVDRFTNHGSNSPRNKFSPAILATSRRRGDQNVWAAFPPLRVKCGSSQRPHAGQTSSNSFKLWINQSVQTRRLKAMRKRADRTIKTGQTALVVTTP